MPMKKELIISGVKPLLGRIGVSWKWYDEKNGTVEYTFSNPGKSVRSVVLYRSSYYFGNAYFPIYLENEGFRTEWSKNTILVDNGVQNNSAPLAVIDFSGKFLVAFVFTLSPGQQWSMLEGGFQGIAPTDVTAYSVEFKEVADFCVEYDRRQVVDWDQQTGTTLKGYKPNPDTVATAYYSCSANYLQLFDDIVTKGKCSKVSVP